MPDIVGDLHHVRGERLHCPVRKHHLIFRCERVELVFRGAEVHSRKESNLRSDLLVKARRRVESRPHSGAAEREIL